MNDKQETRAGPPDLRLLIPVAFGSRGENGVRHALAEAARGLSVEAVLACVGDDDVRPDVLRLRTREEIGRFLADGATAAMDEVAVPLRVAGVPTTTVFALGRLADELMHIAEEHGCTAIAVPPGGIAGALQRAHGRVRVLVVDGEGHPQTAAIAA